MHRVSRRSVVSKKLNPRIPARRVFEESSSDGDPIPTLKSREVPESYYYSYDSESGTPVHVEKEVFAPRPPENIQNGRTWRFRPRKDREEQNEPPKTTKPEPPHAEPDTPAQANDTCTSSSIHNLLVDLSAKRISYHLEVASALKLTGYTHSFSLMRGSELIVSAKFKSSAKEVHIECEDFKGIMLLNREGSQYCLRRESELGQDVCTVRYNKSRSYPSERVCRVYLLERAESLPYVLKSSRDCSERFGARHVIPSTKNCVLVDQTKQEKIAVMKVGKNALCIDAVSEIQPYVVFLVGVSACL